MYPTPWRRRFWPAIAVVLPALLALGALCVGGGSPRSGQAESSDARPVDLGRPSGLPLPSRMNVAAYEQRLFRFLNDREYVRLGWRHDKGVRDTGPYIAGRSYGTHPAVRVYYSPGVVRWLLGGRVGRIPDGEMIVKEQYAAPAARHAGKTEQQLWASLESWTVMVKDSSGSRDGWFWSNPVKGQCVVDDRRYPFPHPVSGFGLYCVRCHAATRSPGVAVTDAANEFTFASLRNIDGFPGEPIRFRVDESWLAEAGRDHAAGRPAADAHPRCTPAAATQSPVHHADRRFLDFFDRIRPARLPDSARLAPVTADHVVPGRENAHGLVTSDQCMSCHAALLAPFGPSMFVPTGKGADYGAPGWDVSPYGEWRWTPMGLAGRDPIFYAQLESEEHLLRRQYHADPTFADGLCCTLADTCLRCHGAMGHRQFHLDHPEARAELTVDLLSEGSGKAGPGRARYGALARDGVSCVVCHRMQPTPQPADDPRPSLQYFLETSTTGNFRLAENGDVYGPFKDDAVAPYVMEHATGFRPKHGDYLTSSRLCGSCHTIALPAVGRLLDGSAADALNRGQTVPLFRQFHHHVEQATYLEWLNSEYEDEVRRDNPRAKSCQDCHMSPGLRDERHGIKRDRLPTRIAAVQDATYPEAENLAPRADLEVRRRDDGFRRHNFVGLNVFLVELFRQFDDVLGVRKTDFMTGSDQGLTHAVDNFVRTARDEVASLEVKAERRGRHGLTARVVVRNKVGHRFPSGVGFRRAFLELLVVEKPKDRRGAERIVWASGRTNELGVLVGSDGRPLATEFFAPDPVTGRQQYQPHHRVITSPEQVQVYETLRRDARGRISTSFVLAAETVKDNRLLPRGWKREGPGPALAGKFLEATYPDATAARTPRYADGSGSDEVAYRIDLPAGADVARLEVRATLYYQALPPYYLRSLFETAPDGPATRRLHYLLSHLDLRGTPIENWKLAVTSAACAVRGGGP